MSTRCSYQWAIVAYPQAPSVIAYVRCKNKTRSECGRCYLHHDARGRHDRRSR